jgi:hypothetical protein
VHGYSGGPVRVPLVIGGIKVVSLLRCGATASQYFQAQAIQKLAPLPETRAARHTSGARSSLVCVALQSLGKVTTATWAADASASRTKHLSPSTCLRIGFLPWLHILTNVMHDTVDAVRAHANLPSPRLLLLEAYWRPPVAVPDQIKARQSTHVLT